MSDDRFSDYMYVRASSSYSCHVCAFSTQRKDNYMRHMQSSRHARHFVSPQDVCDCEDPLPEMSGWHSPESDESDSEQPTDHEVNAAGDTHAPQYDVERDHSVPMEEYNHEQMNHDGWRPFKSKVHFYLCVLNGSKTHHVSDEVLKFIMHTMKACGLDVPSFHEVQNFWLGDMCLDDMLQKNTDDNGNISWMVKPMELLKLTLANPRSSSKISRDTPIGMLHFIYLGLAKHLIKFCFESLDDGKKEKLKMHLDSMEQRMFSYKVSATTMFRYIDSRQGKDFKHYLQLAPFNFEYAGSTRTHVKALKKLALISKHMQQMTEGVSDEVLNYLEFLKENIPSLATKSKTHLGVHLADDMERHGHPLHYLEDYFEKNHGPIRTSLLNQNGHAKSRDTARQFAMYEILLHLTNGGFLKYGDTWCPPGNKVSEEGQMSSVVTFLGSDEVDASHSSSRLKFVERKSNRKPNDKSLDALVHLDALQAVIACQGETTLLDDNAMKVFSYHRVMTRDGNDSRIREFVVFQTDEETSIGMLRTLIEVRSKTCSYQAACVYRTEKDEEHIQRIEVLSSVTWIPITALVEPIHVVHCCRLAKCHVQEIPTQHRSEKENINRVAKLIKHNETCKMYFINKFRFTHSKEKY